MTHKERMVERRARQRARVNGFTPMPNKRFAGLIMGLRMQNQPVHLAVSRWYRWPGGKRPSKDYRGAVGPREQARYGRL